jgi:protein TonB
MRAAARSEKDNEVDFAEDRKMSTNTMIGIAIVILLHIFLVYALVSGLATSAIDVIKKPLEIKIIQAPPAPPPAPPPMTPPPPQLTTPPPPYIPPPIIQVQQPPPPPVFAVTTSVKPPPPAQMAPPPAAPAPSTDVGVVCPNVGSIAGRLADSFQDIAESDSIDSATVVVRFSISADGTVSGARIVSSTDPGVNELALQGIAQLHCNGQGQAVEVSAPFHFSTN